MDNSTANPCVLRVVIDAPLRTPFDYLPPPGLSPTGVPLGVRVRVPVGRRETIGVVVDYADQTSISPEALKAVHQVLDGAALFDPALMQLLRWTADYYHHPLGEVIAAALPRALRDGAPAAAQVERWCTTPAGLAALGQDAAQRAPRQQALLALKSTLLALKTTLRALQRRRARRRSRPMSRKTTENA